MATKRGILADKMLERNCKDYKALPVGFSNSEFQGNLSNPYLPGIKTSKYQRSAPKPVSADVMAVSVARFMVGNRANNAREILNQYQKESKDFKPPPVNLARIQREIEDAQSLGQQRLGQGLGQSLEQSLEQSIGVAPVMPTSYPGTSRGDLMTTQTIGQNAEASLNVDRLMSAYATYDRDRQIAIGRVLGNVFQQEGIVWSNYQISQQVLKGQRIQSQSAAGRESGASLSDRMSMIKRGLSTFEMRQSSANLDEIFGILSSENLQSRVIPEPPESSSGQSSGQSSRRSSGAGPSTLLSEAVTMPGIAQSSTTKTNPEITKK